MGVLAEGLAKTATSGQYRSGLVSDRLTLVSPYDPDSRWFAYTAMERNKLLYGLSDAALVVLAQPTMVVHGQEPARRFSTAA